MNLCPLVLCLLNICWEHVLELKTENKVPIEKEKPNFELSGLLAQDQNNKNGIALEFVQPADAEIPDKLWRLYEFKKDSDVPQIRHIHRKTCYLFGKVLF